MGSLNFPDHTKRYNFILKKLTERRKVKEKTDARIFAQDYSKILYRQKEDKKRGKLPNCRKFLQINVTYACAIMPRLH